MSLIKCTAVIGSQTLVEFDPAIHRIEGAIYAPLGIDTTPWGIYDHGRKFFLPSGTFRGPDLIAPGTTVIMPEAYDSINEVAPDACYIYIGWLHGHYGHFLLSSLSRFWARADFQDKNIKLLYHGPDTIEKLFDKPFFSAISAALKIKAERFICFDKLTIIKSLIIPTPAFEESRFVHRRFAVFGNELGKEIAGTMHRNPSARPMYLSKAKLSEGIGRLLNETELTDILERNGVDVVYPEQLSFPEQIANFYDRDIILGLTGSAMHTSIFAPGRSIIGICYTNSILSNYQLLDKANGTDAHYFYPHDDIELEQRSAEFHLNYRLKDAAKTAEELLRAMQTVMARRRSVDEQRNRDPETLSRSRRNLVS